jgi:ribosome-associated heat shock protein Hsp15
MRIDKYLWCIRVFKTRTLAADACNLGKVTFNGTTVKPSKEVTIGDVYSINLNPLKKTIKVKQILKNRVSAKDIALYYEDLTPKEEYERIEMMNKTYFERRDSHIGRPTKRDRRQIERFKDD